MSGESEILTQVRRALVLLIAGAVASCQVDRTESRTPPAPSLPQLGAFSSIRLESIPVEGDELLALSPGGMMAVATAWDSASRIKVFDSAGEQIRSLGRIGDGPGEIRTAFTMWFLGDSALIAGDPLRARSVIFWLTRDASATITLPPMSFPYHFTDDSIDLFGFSSSGEPQIARYSPATRESRVLVDASSEPFKRLFADPFRENQGNLNLPARAALDDGVVLGKGLTYNLLFYDGSGTLRGSVHRELPDGHLTERQVQEEVASYERRDALSEDPVRSAQQLESIRERVVPHFSSLKGLGVDGVGRVWVVGAEGDSAFADVFLGDEFLGRHSIPCGGFRGSWAVAGERLAFLCEDSDGSTDFEVLMAKVLD